MKRNILFLLCYALFPCMLPGQMTTDSSFLKIEETLLTQLAVYPQEKIHLHTDRDLYVPGEKIWFRAYLTDAATHQPATYSRYIYVELIDARDSLVNRAMIRPENELYYGQIMITDNIPEGNYTLRAYTRYMENLGDDYFFKKNVRITSPSPALPKGEGGRKGGSSSQARSPFTTFPEREGVRAAGPNAAQIHHSPLLGELEGASFDVSFFPEGGNLVNGVFCKVAIKALSSAGYAETIYGELLDETGSVITSVETLYAGMGVFSYVPVLGKRYWVKCRNESGLEKLFELPQPDPRACALVANTRNRTLTLGVRRSVGNPDTPCYLLAHCRGQVFHFSAFNKDTEFISFPEEAMPSGVLQFVLFDNRMNPLSERLIFNKNNNNEATVVFQTDKKVYQNREKVTATIHIPSQPQMTGEGLLSPSPSGRAGEGFRAGEGPVSHLSIAITDDKDIAVDSTHTILSTLLLSSELKGYIENPAYYLQDNDESATALDYLMLTHGWRRYNIPEVVEEKYQMPEIPFQESMAISGRVTGGIRNRPVTDREVLIMEKDGDFGFTATDVNGKFSFDNFEYPDSTSYFIQAVNNKGGTLVDLVLDQASFPKLCYAPQSLFIRQEKADLKIKDLKTEDKDEIDAFLAKALQRSQYEEDMRVIQLSEVEVTAPKIERKDEARLQYWQNQGSDITIRREEIEKSPQFSVTDLLRKVAGIQVSSEGYVYIRQGGISYLPLVLIDGFPVYWESGMTTLYASPVESVSINEVESIDIFKGANAAMFGLKGSGGVISITTKKGIDIVRPDKALNYAVYTPLGYQKPIEFYAPRYETIEAKYLTIPDYRTTIFWKPDIVVAEAGEAAFDFYTSDFPTTYSVVIEGLTTDGSIIRQVERIEVSD